jgi:branched-chain amino acid transport system permease protein
MYALVAVIFLAGVLFVHRIIHSPFGQVVKAVRDNEPRTISLGYRSETYKQIIFVLAAMLAGVGGATKAMVMGIETLSDVGASTSGLVVLMVLLGGIGTIFGPIVGALIVVAMQYYLAPFGAWVVVIQGAIFVVCVLLFRRGIIGEVAYRLKTPL